MKAEQEAYAAYRAALIEYETAKALPNPGSYWDAPEPEFRGGSNWEFVQRHAAWVRRERTEVDKRVTAAASTLSDAERTLRRAILATEGIACP